MHETVLAATLRLDERWSARVAGGLPFIELAELPDLPAGLGRGEAVSLTDPEERPIGFGLFDPDNGLLRTLPADPSEQLDLGFFTRRIDAAFALRQRLGLVDPESAYRLVNGEGDGLAGFLVDIYAGYAIIFTYSDGFDHYVRLLADALDAVLQPIATIAKVRPPGETPTGRVGVTRLSDSDPPRQLVVVEEGVRYEVHLLGGINSGLFCDMREVRKAFGQLAPGCRVLNTFSYTGSFSVVAALAGAESVTSVDFAAGVLHWSKTNFELNGLAPNDSRFRFVRGDVFDFLKTARRKDRLYDAIVLDPPASSAVPGRRWHMKSDYDRLIGHALPLLAPGGLLVVAASSFGSRPDKLENQIRSAARDRGRRLALLQSFGLPPDFPTQMIHAQHRYLKCYFLKAD